MLMSAQQVADLYGFSVSQIRRLIREGKLKANKIGSYYAIDARSIKSLVRRRSPTGTRKAKIDTKSI